jgi:DmsE family decaheme c-type cytochrome
LRTKLIQILFFNLFFLVGVVIHQSTAADITKFGVEDVHSALLGLPDAKTQTSLPHDDVYRALAQFAAQIDDSREAKFVLNAAGQDRELAAHGHGTGDEAHATLLNYVRQLDAEQPQLIKAGQSDFHVNTHSDAAYEALRDFARQLEGEEPRLTVAQAAKPPAKPPAAAKPRPRPKSDPGYATLIGSQVCLGCHARQAADFNRTLMGKVFLNPRTPQERGGCETCHGPGSEHLKAVGCAACHGEGGITRSPGTPNLIGQDPQYLVPAMKAYLNGQRQHPLKRMVLAGISDSEMHNIANYYARQPAARAPTPLIGDAGAGRNASGLCADCHGERGISIVPAWPSLAGQDAQYLANAIRAYKHGSRSKAIACAACHGSGGISNKSGMPSLVGQNPEYLVPAMRAYVNGDRKHKLMGALVSGLGESELESIAQYYAGQPAARAQTSLVGDPSAGKSAAGLCIGCHGEQGVAVDPAWPSLAGQDARYLADAITDYKDGSRSKVVACAACHGEGGISTRAGMPSLVGLDPQYLVAAMKAYTSGQRKHELMKALLADVSETELNSIALYYARQTPARARTAGTGDATAGKAASAACAGCHGEQGVSANPIWPSLAGQDARYLADATKAYKDGSRGDATMKALVTSLDDRTINDIATYYASLRPAQPSAGGVPGTPATRDPVLVRNSLVASLDQRAINDVASYFASLRPAQPHGARGGGRDPVLIRNNLVASLDERSINNVASYYATLQPAQPHGIAAGPIPARVGTVRTDRCGVGGIISFRADDSCRTVEETNAICLSCHQKGARTHWSGSTHELRAVACTNCHTIMTNVTPKFQLAKATEMDTCFQCHKDKRAQIWRSSHMPVRERGGMTCSSCHNPHGSYSEALLKEATINDTCYKCHAEKRGPFLYEHPPVRENCLNCHDPHGSNNDFLLKISRPRLCQQCHANLTGHPGNPRNPTSIYAFNRECQNCHSQHHGSNTPGAGARWHR